MKKQKSVIIISILAAAVLLLAACGGQKAEPAQEPQTQEAAAAETAEPSVEDPAEEASAEEADAAEEQAAAIGAKDKTEWSLGSFKTMDLDGNEVTESVFAEKEYTMVNLWGTFCPPCIAEMPDLQSLNESLPGNMQMIGLVSDLYYDEPSDQVREEALEILGSAGADYRNLMLWTEAGQLIGSFTSFVPTTFFVDAEGTIVGEPIIGADVEAYKARISELEK